MIKKRNVWPVSYFQNPNPKKKLEEIWDDIDGYTFEDQFEREEKFNNIDFVIPFPPLDYKGVVTKGMFYSQALDLIVERHPGLKKIFFPIANSMFSSYPGSEHADMYFTCYKNKKREKWFKKNHPDKKNVIMLPLQDADFMNEYNMAPTFNTPKKIDVFCVTTAYPVKNLPMLAAAIKMYELKYAKRLKVVWAIGSRDAKRLDDGTLDYSNMRWDAKEELDKVKDILGGDIKKYIDIYPYIEYVDLAKYYTGAKCCVLSSIMEGKNRGIFESISCNTPVIVFKDHNKFARCGYPVFFGNSGEYAPEFTSESLADTIHKVLNNLEKYEPRKNYLIYGGRKNFLNKIIDANPYYKKHLPEYKKGKILENVWVDLAMQDNYQISTYDFLYGKNTAIQHISGIPNIDNIIKFFYSRFKVSD
ncbi:glycosyltransferase [bacterium]|nr:glycosyltransferase [bacterium]